MQTVLFYRDLRKFHGGHLKVWDYFNHVLASPHHTARIGFSPKTRWGPENPWGDESEYVTEDWSSTHADIFFVAGRDWAMLDRHPGARPEVPVVNLVQGLRHADPQSSRYEFLSRKAIRVCVSDEVARAVRDTGRTSGPVITIPNGLDLDAIRGAAGAERDIDVLIVAIKQPALGEELERRLGRPGRRVELLIEPVPRPDFLHRMRRARTSVFLPLEAEGFYLPALEGMAAGTLVVCPEHDGAGSVYVAGENCLRPPYTTEGVAEAAEEALALPQEESTRLGAAAQRTAEGHSLKRERAAFLEILRDLDRLW